MTQAVLTKFVRPLAGRLVRDPDDKKFRPLPPEGKTVAWRAYWMRLVKAGDIEVLDAAPAPAPAAPLAPPAPPPPPGGSKLSPIGGDQVDETKKA